MNDEEQICAEGDYVLAAKYSDGDPQDHWCIGFYKYHYTNSAHVKLHIVADANGKSFRANGFRRVEKISKERGAWMLQNARAIESSGRSVWHFAACEMNQDNIVEVEE